MKAAGRPREFDRELALQGAMKVFWAKGFAATSMEDLVSAMGIGRQSLYNAFGDKRQLYLEALRAYQHATTSAHLARLDAPASPLEGIHDLLAGLAAPDDEVRALGCMGVGSVCEFGAADADLARLREKTGRMLARRVLARLRDGQARSEVAATLDAEQAARHVLMTMAGIQVAARGGASVKEIRKMARFATDQLAAR
ncbi:helix-turn-helix domain-containing protein [Pseudoxanthomonas putridarboris]|uniref:Helix-turn-helix domain-containing protein n=1 Tax=Pseudoxanthomonas putridarboris TaxID=752605 RepID=A0ABU9IVN6_9GAMM